MSRELGHSFHTTFQSFFLSSGVLFFLSLCFVITSSFLIQSLVMECLFVWGVVQIYGDGDKRQDAEAAGD
jgi:hypothetical protein